MWYRSAINVLKQWSSRHRTSSQRTVSRRLAVEALDERIVLAALSVGDVTIVEGHAGAQYAQAVVRLSEPAANTVVVNYHTADGTATAASDYDAVSGRLSFAPGVSSMTILVPVRGDRLGEFDETFVVKLTAAKNAKVADGTGVVTIRDDEPRIGVGDAVATEGNAGTTLLTFTVSLSRPYDEAVTVAYSTADGTATAADGDYAAASGLLTFAPGETTITVTVEVGGDTAPEGDEYLFVNLSGASSNTLLADGQGVGHIFDDDGGTDEDICLYVCCNPDGCGDDSGNIAP